MGWNDDPTWRTVIATEKTCPCRRRSGAAGQLHDRRRQIDQMTRIVPQFAVSFDTLGPVNDQRRRDAAFMNEDFRAAQRSIGQVGPAWLQADVRLGRTDGRLGIMA